MKAGRELDVLVGEKVFPDKYKYHGWKRNGGLVPHYSTSIADAWLVVEKLKKDDNCEIHWHKHEKFWEVNLFLKSICERADTAPHAICLASLRTVGADVETIWRVT